MSNKLRILLLLVISSVITLNAQITNRIFVLGNSVTDGINYDGFQSIANQRGNNHVFGRQMIPGSPLTFLYTNSTSGFTTSPYGYWPNAFANYDWDCISFQPFDRDLYGSEGDFTMISNWANYIKANRANYSQLQFYIYSRYPRVPNGKTYQNASAADWNNLWLGTYGAGGNAQEEKSYFERLLNTVRGANLMPKPANMVPVGDVMHALNQKMVAGKMNGYSSIWNVYSDGIHVNNVGSFILGATFFATMYKQDPRGLSVPTEYGNITDAIRDTILQTVYQVVFNHSFSGTSLNDIVAPTGVSISPKNYSLSFLQSVVLTKNVTPSNASNKNVTWLSNNTAVASVNKDGKVVGVGTGIATITGTTNVGGFFDFAVISVSGLTNYSSTTGVLIGWDFANKPNTALGFNATFANPNIITTDGISFATIGNGVTIRTDGFGTGGLMATSQTTKDLNSSIGANEYLTFRIKPISGKLININKISFASKSEGGEHTFILMSSLKGFNPSQILGTVTGGFNQMNNFTITGHENISQEVEFRVYITGTTNNGTYNGVGIGVVNGNDFQIEGAVLSPVDAIKPSSVTGINVSQYTDKSFFLSWNESTDNMIVTGYNIYLNGTKLNSQVIESTSYSVNSLTSGLVCNLSITAVDFVGNESIPATKTVIINRKPTAVISASGILGLAPFTFVANSSLSSDPDTDSGDLVLGFDWDMGDGSPIINSNNVSYTYTAVGVYVVKLKVVDTRNMRSDSVTQTINVTSVISDVIPPSVPTLLAVTINGSNSVLLSWNASTDNYSLSGYLLSVNGVVYTISSGITSYSVVGLNPSTKYLAQIQAFDISGNKSTITGLGFTTSGTNIISNSISLEQSHSGKIEVYPNPANGGMLNISMPISGEIIDCLGNKVLEFANTKAISVSGLCRGIYLLLTDSQKVKVIIE